MLASLKSTFKEMRSDETGGINAVELFVVAPLLAVITFGMGQYAVNSFERDGLRKEIVSINDSYKEWYQENPAADLDTKKQAILDAAQPYLTEGKLGLALDEKENALCLWKAGTSRGSNNQGIIAGNSKFYGSDCTTFTTVLAPDGTVKPASEKPIAKPAEKPAPAQEFPWSMMLGILATTGVALGGTGGIIFGVQKYRRNKSVFAGKKEKWQALVNRHDTVRKNWALYELDPMMMLDYPVLSDMSEKVTADLHMALRKAKDLQPQNLDNVANQEPNGSLYQEAVLNAEHAFNIAVSEAKKVQWSKFSADEQKRLSTAKNLLSLAMDSGASEFERQMAYKRLQKEITGLINLPDASITAIETQIKMMVEA